MDRSLLHELAPENFGPLLARLLAIADDAVIVADAAAAHRAVQRRRRAHLRLPRRAGDGPAAGDAAARDRRGRCTSGTCASSPSRRWRRGAWASGATSTAGAPTAACSMPRPRSRTSSSTASCSSPRSCATSASRARRRARVARSEARFRALASSGAGGHLPDRRARPVCVRQRTLVHDGRHGARRGAGQRLDARGAPGRPRARAAGLAGRRGGPVRRSTCATASCGPTAPRPGWWAAP